MNLIVLVLLAFVAACQQNYTIYRNFSSPNSKYIKAAITDSIAVVIFYSPSSNIATPFSGLNWTSLSSSFYSEFPFPLNSV